LELVEEIAMVRYCVIILGLMAMPAGTAWASRIDVSGMVYGEWNSDTVVVTGDINIPPDNELNILPGVKVLFDGPWSFTIMQDAKITAVGTPEKRIVFEPMHAGSTWRGLRMISCCGLSVMDYCDFRRSAIPGESDTASGGAICLTNSNLAIYHCTFDSCSAYSGGAIACLKGSGPFITNSVFRWNRATYAGAIICDSNSAPQILADTFLYNYVVKSTAAILCRNNSNPEIDNCEFSGNSTDSGAMLSGGVIRTERSGPRITNNMIRDNQTLYDGAIVCAPGVGEFPAVVIDHNTIRGHKKSKGIVANKCVAHITNNIVSGNGNGGIWCSSVACTIAGNTVTGNGGGGIVLTSSASAVSCNRISGNTSPSGAGIQIAFCDLAPRIEHNIISGNSASIGGGIYVYQSTRALIRGNLIVGNTADSSGGALYFQNSVIDSIAHNIIAFNSSGTNFGAVAGEYSRIGLENCVIYHNMPTTDQIEFSGSSDAFLVSCDIQGGWSNGVNNIDIDPLFRDTATGDYFATASGIVTKQLATCGNGIPDSMEVWVVPTTTEVPNDPLHSLPTGFALEQNYPNPFNPSTTIAFSIPYRAKVTLEVFNALGRLVRTVTSCEWPAGRHTVVWDGSDDRRLSVSSGVYLYRLQVDAATVSKKMLLLK
jgi:parallel beta-helix repeat protein